MAINFFEGEKAEKIATSLETIADHLENLGSPEAIAEDVTAWMDEHITENPTVVIDDSLSIRGAAADAKKTGDEISNLKSDLRTRLPQSMMSEENDSDLDITDLNGNVLLRLADGHIQTKDFDSSLLESKFNGKQNKLTFDNEPTANSDNPVKSSGIYITLSGKQNVLTFDDEPEEESDNPVKSSGIYSAIQTVTNKKPVIMDSDEEDIDLDVSDMQGDVLVRFVDGHIKTKYFDSKDNIVKQSNADNSNLDITDQYGNVVLRIADGHIQTGKFNSKLGGRLWEGKKWSCIGDSLTEVNSRTTLHYHDYIAEATGITVENYGHSGAGYYYRTNDYTFRLQATRIPTDSDVVTVFGGGNDAQLSNLPIGDVTDATINSLCGCVNITIQNLYARIPLINLGIVTPIPWYITASATDWTPWNPGNRLEDYSEAIKEICKRRSIPCLDLYHTSNLRPSDSSFRAIAFSKDDGNGIHPDENGHFLIASRFLEFLDTLLM